MGLQPLEFSDCLTDSPYFREKLHAHEKELERTSKGIKGLISECKELISATKNQSKAQKSFSHSLQNFKFECIGCEQTEDEKVIEQALKEFGNLIANIEEEREKILSPAFKAVIEQLEGFRKDKIGAAKEEKKKFEKSTTKFCQALEKHLAMKSKSSIDVQKDGDAHVDMEKKNFYESSMQYVLVLQEVQERKKFEFVETLLLFMLSWLTFYHHGHEVSKEFESYRDGLSLKLQKCRENFDVTSKEAEHLKRKMLEVRGSFKPLEHKANTMSKNCTREGYLYLMEKKPLNTTWSKVYCEYTKENKILRMIPYSQAGGKGITTETNQLLTCRRRATDTIDRRFCFDATVGTYEKSNSLTLQALSDDDMHSWLQAMDGKEPIYSQPVQRPEYDSLLDDIGFQFINRCITCIEERGLEEQGLYRIVGVSSKVSKLTTVGLDRRKADKVDFSDTDLWETKTVTSALKNYFRSLPEPIMTFELHPQYVAAAKRESKTLRICDIHELLHKLPEQNFEMLKILVAHLKRVSQFANKNLMTVPNLGVCFGPTLLRAPEETMAAIMDIKWCNIVIELLIYNFEKFFTTPPEGADVNNSRVLTTSAISSEPVISSLSSSTCHSLHGSQQSQINKPVSGHTRPHSYDTPLSNTHSVINGNQHHTAVTALSNTAAAFDNSSSSSRDNKNTVNNGSMTNSYLAYMSSGGPEAAPPQTYKEIRQKIKPQTGFHSQYSQDHNSSRSSSSESLNSRSSGAPPAQHSSPVISSSSSSQQHDSPRISANIALTASMTTNDVRPNKHSHSSVQQAINRFSQPALNSPNTGKRVRALYSCNAENDSELSFEPNDVISNVRMSKEPGWLEGSLNGKSGLVPANYIVYME